ncbi:hypothetical protein EB796_005847 [Bugula neritina]|uniref:Potassium channel domain-containing protein n=1 Tax=Bugula neritina TaxID=10212 RepID=A0A7J7KB28_BUGNE|nr:hypothetical protein EB796_005847 [Bugula neritina]
MGPYTNNKKLAVTWTMVYFGMVIIYSINVAAMTSPVILQRSPRLFNMTYQKYMGLMFSSEACTWALTYSEEKLEFGAYFLIELFAFIFFGLEIFNKVCELPEEMLFSKVNEHAGCHSNDNATYWWVVVTMTTVGYGDYYPKNTLGYAVAAVIMLFGLMITALPIAIIGANFTVYYEYTRGGRKFKLKRNFLSKTTKFSL